MRRTLSVISEDNPGVLTRLAGLIYRRGYNVESLSVGRTDVPGFSRFTVVVNGDDAVIDQVAKQLDKLIEVVSVRRLSPGNSVERWLLLMKVRAPIHMRHQVLQTAEIFRCRVVDVGAEAVVLELTGDKGKVEACVEALRPYGILEMTSSGSVAMERAGFAEARDEREGNAYSPADSLSSVAFTF
ncbi:MAG TPA: acetolactate synthase small subunit [Synergistales bacterium]|nr:acetolactate synthase small subunit [Synergistales bacterium]